jgi:hypothetical protein
MKPKEGVIGLKKLDLHLLKIAVETYEMEQHGMKGDAAFLINTIDSVFSSITALGQSFLVL